MKKLPAKSLAQNKPQNTEEARAYAFLLLKFRLRSANELLQRLRQKGFSEQLSRSTIEFLKEKNFIDDRVFAKAWVGSRLNRPFGLRRIKMELSVKGLDKEIIESTLNQAKCGYDETRVVSDLAKQRFSKQKGIEPRLAKSRVYAYLLRRGFSPDIVNDVIKQL